MKKSKLKQWFPYVLFAVYLGAVLWITLISRQPGSSKITLTPFWEYAHVLKNDRRLYFLKQIIGNILLLMPFGFLTPFLPKFQNLKCRHIIPWAFCFSVLIELIQFITGRGHAEFDDVFNNVLGAALGYGICVIVKRSLREFQ